MGIRAHNPTVWPVADHSYTEGERGKRGRERVYLGSGIAGQKEEEQTKKVPGKETDPNICYFTEIFPSTGQETEPNLF